MNEIKKTNNYTELAAFDFSQLQEENQGAEFSFDTYKFPTGGMTAFIQPDDMDDDGTVIKDITGVILYSHLSFSYYSTAFSGSNVPPECFSNDGITGTGNPGGSCKICPFNQFGSGGTKAKACKNRRTVYILREGEFIPIILSVPAGSVGAYNDYVKHLFSKQHLMTGQVVTKVTLKKSVNSDGIAFSQAVFKPVRRLDADELKALETVKQQVKKYANEHANAANDYENNGSENSIAVDPDTGEVISPCK